MTAPQNHPSSLLPLRPVDLQLLLALTVGELHGYGLVQAIARASGGLVRLEPGNLYRVIRRLLAAGLVAEAARRRAADLGDERRRFYRITALGEQVAAAEVRRLRSLLGSAAVRALVSRVAT